MAKTPTGHAASQFGADAARHGGKDGGRRDDRGGKGQRRDRPEAAAPVAPQRIGTVRTVVEKRPGVAIVKVSQVNHTTHAASGIQYFVEFDGHEPIAYGFLSAARERAKEPAPVKAAEPEADAAGDVAAAA